MLDVPKILLCASQVECVDNREAQVLGGLVRHMLEGTRRFHVERVMKHAIELGAELALTRPCGEIGHPGGPIFALVPTKGEITMVGRRFNHEWVNYGNL